MLSLYLHQQSNDQPALLGEKRSTHRIPHPFHTVLYAISVFSCIRENSIKQHLANSMMQAISMLMPLLLWREGRVVVVPPPLLLLLLLLHVLCVFFSLLFLHVDFNLEGKKPGV